MLLAEVRQSADEAAYSLASGLDALQGNLTAMYALIVLIAACATFSLLSAVSGDQFETNGMVYSLLLHYDNLLYILSNTHACVFVLCDIILKTDENSLLLLARRLLSA